MYDIEIPYEQEFRPAWQPGLLRSSRDFTIVCIDTEEGITGYAGTDGHHTRTIERWVRPFLVGKQVCAVESHASVFRRAGGMWFIDLAVWDVIGKVAGLPLHKLWGSWRDNVPAYASTAELGTPTDRAELAVEYRALGFRAIKLRFHHERMEDDLAVVDTVMEAVPDMTVMVDANKATTLPSPEPSPRWDYKRALQTARELQRRGVLWLEEPLGRYSFDELRRLREDTEIDIAGGEKNQGLHEFRWLIEKGVYDIVQPDCTMSEGISQVRKIAAAAEMWNRKFVPHHGLSGLGLAATLHLLQTTPGNTWAEVMYEPSTRSAVTYQCLGGVLKTAIWIDEEGLISAPEGSGLGVEVDEAALKGYRV
jgi:D-galactarolactone cycloisomerase